MIGQQVCHSPCAAPCRRCCWGRRYVIGAIAVLGATLNATIGLGGAQAASREVDLALVLAIDISASVSADEHRLQLEGYARAFRSAAILDAIAAGGNASIAVTVLEWANTRAPMQSVSWTLIGDAKTAEAFAAMIEALPYHPVRGTSIGSAIAFAHQLLDEVPYSPLRRVVDISGDGKSMQEPRLASARLAALDAGITINGLPISDNRDSDLADYYSHWVIGGPGAFLVLADGFTSFDQAIHQKLVLEIADTTLGVAVRLAQD